MGSGSLRLEDCVEAQETPLVRSLPGRAYTRGQVNFHLLSKTTFSTEALHP